MGTRKVFAIIVQKKSLAILLSKREDGMGWNLPGGRVKEGESDAVGLVRNVREKTGLVVEVGPKIGPDHINKGEAAAAYLCFVRDGELTPSKEVKQHRYVSREEIRTPKILGPEGRLGLTGRMAYDGLSLIAIPKLMVGNVENNEDYFVSDDNCFLLKWVPGPGNRVEAYRRMDPYSPTGFMEPTT